MCRAFLAWPKTLTVGLLLELMECLINFLKILVNMSNAISTYSFFSTQPELVLTLLSHLFQCPVPASYDLALLIYGLLSNLFEKSRLLRELFRSSSKCSRLAAMLADC